MLRSRLGVGLKFHHRWLDWRLRGDSALRSISLSERDLLNVSIGIAGLWRLHRNDPGWLEDEHGQTAWALGLVRRGEAMDGAWVLSLAWVWGILCILGRWWYVSALLDPLFFYVYSHGCRRAFFQERTFLYDSERLRLRGLTRLTQDSV